MLPKDKIFHSNDREAIWQRFCGFLDLSVQEFMEIQEQLLHDEIEIVANTPLGKKILRGTKPEGLAEFRAIVPLTSYQDYAAYIGDCQGDALCGKPFYWAHTSGAGGSFKWAPYFLRNDEVASKNIVAAFILAAANQKGEINIRPGVRGFINFPPRPYVSGWAAYNTVQRISAVVIPPLEMAEKMEFQERTQVGLKMVMVSGMEVICCMSSILVKVGESMSEQTQRMKFSPFMLRPQVLMRLIRARLKAKREKHPMLPRDLWRLKAVVAWGVDTAAYKERIAYYWGKLPYELYVATEVGIIAVQAWNKKAMTLLPDSAFYEFIPEDEWLKSQDDPRYQPATVLLNELEAGKRYELVISDFYGMPFLRYRLGDLIKIVALKDKEIGINLPQFVFDSRADDLISIAGFPWFNERIVWQAIVNTGIKCNDWTLRKEWDRDNPVLHLYIELKEERTSQEVEQLVHQQLKAVDSNYADLEKMLEIQPLRVTLLPVGTFQRYYDEKRKAGYDLARLRPKHMNPADSAIQDIIRLSSH